MSRMLTVKRATVAMLSVAAVTALARCAGSGASWLKPTPTARTVPASEAEVASVIAEYAPDWQEMIDGASRCR
jgi:hypothetical protein